MANLQEVLFPPCLRFSAFVDLPLACGARKRKEKNKDKPNAAIFDLFMCLFLYLFYSLSARRLPSCAFGCLSVPL